MMQLENSAFVGATTRIYPQHTCWQSILAQTEVPTCRHAHGPKHRQIQKGVLVDCGHFEGRSWLRVLTGVLIVEKGSQRAEAGRTYADAREDRVVGDSSPQ